MPGRKKPLVCDMVARRARADSERGVLQIAHAQIVPYSISTLVRIQIIRAWTMTTFTAHSVKYFFSFIAAHDGSMTTHAHLIAEKHLFRTESVNPRDLLCAWG